MSQNFVISQKFLDGHIGKHIYDADLKGDNWCGTTCIEGGAPTFFISEITIQGSVYVQNLMENEIIESYFEFP